jgi:UDP-glucose 4-epimerase
LSHLARTRWKLEAYRSDRMLHSPSAAPMRVLITGGAGFIGSHLSERCLHEQWKVSVLDDLSTGAITNIEGLRANRDFTVSIGSVLDVPLVAELVDACDVVFHLAAAVGVRLVLESPVQTMKTNVAGTETVLAAAARKRQRVIIASTSEVYGKSAQVPFREDADLVLGPSTASRWSYACSKALDEFLGIAYWREKRVPVTIVRLFNAVGPRQTGRYGMVLPTFVRQALSQAPLTVFGDGSQTRCFGYVGDVVQSLVRIAVSDSAAGEVINIGNDQEISILGLAQRVKELTHSSSEIQFVPYEDAYGPGFEDMNRRVPSLEKLESLTGSRPTTPIDQIIREVAAQSGHEQYLYAGR